MKKILLLLSISIWALSASAHEYRNLLQKKANLSELKKSLVPNQKWVYYPAYEDREGWDKLTANNKEEIISKGEAALDYSWQVIKASDYIEFERSGARRIMEDPFGENNIALSNLVLAELCEGKGRFIDQIVNGVWYNCEMTSWALSAHIAGAQAVKTSLPSYKEQVIDLTSGDLGAFFAWTYYFLKDEMDKVNPLVSERLLQNIQERIMDPYMERSNFWWQAFDAKPNTMVNNWNPWCNASVLTCFLLLENNPEKLAEAVFRSMTSVDKFINYYHSDGACEEGPSYWGHAAGKMFDYLQLLHSSSNGKVSIFDEPLIKKMGEYISKSYIGDGWVVNFADASAKGGGSAGLIYRYGKAVGSSEMQTFAAYLRQQGYPQPYSEGRDLYRSMENLYCQDALAEEKSLLSISDYTWYPETEFCYMRQQSSGFFFAAKGGFNNESHNHNDVGSFILYHNNFPVFIEAGVGTYTRQTFSAERYSIWTMQSNYHNLPLINGFAQSFGSKYRSADVVFDAKKSIFSLNLAKAYPEEAGIVYWKRSYQLKNEGLSIEDDFKLKHAKENNQINFLSQQKPDIAKAGTIVIDVDGTKIKMTYDKSLFEPLVEKIDLPDKRLSRVWGDNIYRLSLRAKKGELIGKYKFFISK
ncbi:heparinase [Bacteroidales bacterium]|nr:heparinase [Bacteroidales bacterium]